MRKVGLWAASLAAVTFLTVGCGVANSTGNTSGGKAAVNSTATSGNQTAGTGNTASTAGNSTANNSTTTANTTGGVSNGKTGQAQRWTAMPKMTINPNKQYTAVVQTNYGTFTMDLFAKKSPITVNNFVFLANQGFYNGDTFFRIIQNFMIQTGDPNNNGTGGPGYTIPDELPPSVPYTAGVVAMANTGQPHSGGSQFFICTVNDTQKLAPNYTELGKVVSGMSVIGQIAAIPVTANPQMGGEMSKPLKKAVIEKVTIQVK
ncbi:peptidylprolyl isomerase [Alicyclobacillus sp. ALC3]|uniref:peptidylprolyl isomerase n=1 Tax=Alicyclobacillus sp. ALC3 TaxID=2796143 RepID=UPI002379F013|nr:peptidylprolyl isomerase [Alicyclobacillus sp. ALC3]WDL95422.1 peptidylprolyl isomerase [Alicyclobacillus sp. ALC3]